jgi:poly(3-hydroxyalkanoate) synthetase
MKYLSIDSLLADLNVAIDDLGGLVNLVGLCQGGWMSVLYAARFPGKVARVVAAGSPLDVAAEASHLSAHAAATPLPAFQELVQDGDGLVLGHDMLRRWSSTGGGPQVHDILMMPPDVEPEIERATSFRFADWFGTTLDLPGTYYLQVVQWLYQENRLVQDRMPALGKLARLGDVTAQVLLLAASDDEIVPARQIFAAAKCFSASPAPVLISAPGPHLGLFLGQRTMTETWPVVADWLGGDTAQSAKRARKVGPNDPPGRPQRSRTKRPGASPSTG